MSTFNCPVVSIKSVVKHTNADSLDIVTFNEIGWVCVEAKDKRNVGDKVVYIPTNSKVPINRPEFSFLEKISKNGYARIKTIRLRGAISQGLIVDCPEGFEIGDDCKEFYDVIKYVPPSEDKLNNPNGGTKWVDWGHKTDAERYQNVVQAVELYRNEPWYMTVKVDGTSSTFYLEQNELEDKYGICSRNLDISTREGSFYHQIEKENDLFVKLKKMATELDAMKIMIQGEICGPGIQKNTLGLDKKQFFAFDIYIVKEGFEDYIPYENFFELCKKYDIPTVTLIGIENLPTIDNALIKANSLRYESNYPAEGIVFVKKVPEIIPQLGRAKVKIISQEYELKKGD